MTKKISELPAASSAADSDQFETNQGGTSRRVTRGQIVTGLAAAAHAHELAEISDAGALAGKDEIGTADIAAAAYASQAEAAAGTDNAKLMTALRTKQAIEGAGVGATTIGGLTNVADAADAANDGDGLFYNAANGQFVAKAPTQASVDNVDISMQDKVLTRPALKDYAEISTTPSSSAGVLTLDCTQGNDFEVTLTENVTTLNLTNPPAAARRGSISLTVKQDTTGEWTLTWPATVKWQAGIPPTVTRAPGAIDVYGLITRDAGATWYGFPGAQDLL